MFFNKHKSYIGKQIEAIQRKIWDLEFERFKFEEIKEEVRQEYDRKQAQLVVFENQIKAEEENPTLPKEELARIKDETELLKRDIERHLAQMTDCDTQIFGLKASAENPQGFQGINQQLDYFRELTEMLVAFKKSL